MNGILLAIQFFTAFPVTKELPLGRKEVTAMYVALPFVGAAIGLSMYGMAYLLLDVGMTGTFLAAVLVTLTGVVLTGGLHLDGWADTGDAFFSYKDQEKRHEILGDPRLGAFGTMALVFLIVLRIALFNELFLRGMDMLLIFIAVPFLSRIGLNIYFTTVKSAKDKGLAHFFKEKLNQQVVVTISIIAGLLFLGSMAIVLETVVVPIVLFIVLAVSVWIFKSWSVKHFGGVTGDLSGTFIEGVEVLLWIVLLLFI
ncbi:adenosylcobinamide-GDP ribazoletransferase [Sporosarcina sp. G11-34]|uniref:adenosylcobinamide-GDP ribazoletransferase n=1 Tax=Sporosarcina sp. G11-34 TaxID=2849605 RepID=UPI0022A9D653|nr:adenosylcobinamide-GDP ribazoletransferase [Sporosarcina sp. G11-34]MCZ2257500.1 adenosylcobinamide-GDP ribazoletransferase [Sporosarcina sp. G11-34]